MVEINVTKMSSKGQIVIPSEMRKNFSRNERFILIQNKDQIILKKVTDFKVIVFLSRTCVRDLYTSLSFQSQEFLSYR